MVKGRPDKLVVLVPVDPKTLSVNKHFRNRSVMHPTTRASAEKIEKAVRAEIDRTGWLVPVGPIGISIVATFADRRGDLDNHEKYTVDAVARAAKFDDAKLAELHLFRRLGEPSLEITVYETVLPGGDTGKRSYQNQPTWNMEDA